MGFRVTVLTGIFPPEIGGPATSVPDLIRQLVRQGREPAVVTLADLAETTDGDPCPIIRIPRSLPRLRRVREVVRAVHVTKPDVVLANGLHVESAFVVGVPIVQKIVGDWAWERARNKGWTSAGVEAFQEAALPLKARAVRLLRTAVTRRAALVIAPSKHVSRLVQAWGVDEERVRIVPNAAPPVSRLEGRRTRRGLFVGRLVRWKHVDDVIHVLQRVDALELEIIGSGPELESLQRLSRTLGVDARVVFHGPMPRERVLKKMLEAGFLVLPSSYEGMPHVVLEAFAAGLPVVASDAPGTLELVKPGVSALVYPCGQLEALENAVQRVLDPEVSRCLAEGGSAVAKGLTAEASATATSVVLEEALKR
jgi:glycosyltransferase involved in cell wall biosynthesis